MNKIVKVEIPGDNTQNVEDMITILKKLPWDALVRSSTRPNEVITVWWEEPL